MPANTDPFASSPESAGPRPAGHPPIVRIASGALGVVIVAGLLSGSVVMAAVDSEKVAKVKAAYLLNFLRFATFASDRFDKPNSPYRIFVVGEDPMNGILDATLDQQTIAGRSFVVERYSLPHPRDKQLDDRLDDLAAAMQQAHMVFIGDGDRVVQQAVIQRIPPTALSVGMETEHAVAGCMLALSIDDDRVVFYANFDAIKASEVQLSSKLLRLARELRKKGNNN